MPFFRAIKTDSSVTGTFFPIAAGLFVAQAIATAFVYLSNIRLHAAVTAIEKAGYFPIPNGIVAATLHDIDPAVWGGLFFTLSIGTGLSLTTWATVLVWDRMLNRPPKLLVVMAMAWAGLIALVNLKGVAWFPSLFCCLVPLATAWTTLRNSETGRQQNHRWMIVPMLTLVLLTALWATQLNKQLFVSIRDHVLLSNAVGRSVNDFYYKYTLYAAEAFKSFNQKTIRTARFKSIGDASRPPGIEQVLARSDVILTADLTPADITIVSTTEGLQLESNGKTIIDTPLNQFFRKPVNDLQAFSRKTDRFGPFRKLTLIGLLVGFPILLFIMAFGSAMAGLTLFLGNGRASVGASVLCLVIGIFLFLPVLKARPLTITADTLADALSSGQWPRRVAALRHIDTYQIEIARYPQYLEILNSPHVAERYWLARALAASRASATYDQLMILLKDLHPNVVCQACYALGQRGRRSAIAPIQAQMARSDHWYTQWYGYRAIRKLGWHQNRSQ